MPAQERGTSGGAGFAGAGAGNERRLDGAELPAPGAEMTDEIVLTLPRERRFYDVAHLVVSGLGARLNLTMDNLADLQLALDGLLPRRETGGDVTVVIRIHDELLDGQIGPFDTEAVAELERIGGDGYGIPVVLKAVFDSYRVDVDGGEAWVHFTKTIATLPQKAEA